MFLSPSSTHLQTFFFPTATRQQHFEDEELTISEWIVSWMQVCIVDPKPKKHTDSFPSLFSTIVAAGERTASALRHAIVGLVFCYGRQL